MTTIEMARKLADYQQVESAQKAYALVLGQAEKTPEEELEAANYLFFSQGNYQMAYSAFVSLYNRGHFQTELMDLMLQAFYLPNVDEQKARYEANCQALAQYPYLFRQDFPAFEDLPVLFFPYDDHGVIPFSKTERHFGAYVDFRRPVIDRYFFKDLENPILAQDVFSQYQLEYLNDNVRKSEWVGRENHIYLHYSDWMLFCTYLPCLDFVPLLTEQKLVFLFGEEISQYPIDFKARFGIDYSQYPVKPIGIREVKRMIWHTQLAAHNGTDFFNEVLYGHPNLLIIGTTMWKDMLKNIKQVKERLRKRALKNSYIQLQLGQLKAPTDKDILVSLFLDEKYARNGLDAKSRIVPALLFQPHFSNIQYELRYNETTTKTALFSKEYDAIKDSPIFREFKYIKAFTAMRRITTSYGATIRFMQEYKESENTKKKNLVGDAFSQRLLNRSFMVDPKDRLYQDSVLVRFEDGKLNPTATFTALAEFLDIPYTESMTYCSGISGINPESLKGNDRGFDPAAVYRTYDDYSDDADRALLEYFMRDAYARYGYQFHYYQGEEVDLSWIDEKLSQMITLDQRMLETFQEAVRVEVTTKDGVPVDNVDTARAMAEKRVTRARSNRFNITHALFRGLCFVSHSGQPLRYMDQLKLDPALLEQPLYH